MRRKFISFIVTVYFIFASMQKAMAENDYYMRYLGNGAPGSYAAASVKTQSGKDTKWKISVEMAADGDYRFLNAFANSKEDMKRAVSSAYVLYNQTGDERYEDVGTEARRLFMKLMIVSNTVEEKIIYTETVMAISKDADAYTPGSPFIDAVRYKEIEDYLQKMYNRL